MTPLEAAAAAVEDEIMGYTKSDGTYVQGAVNFWDDNVENATQVARAAGEALLDVEVIAETVHTSQGHDHPWENCPARGNYLAGGHTLRAALLGDES